MFADEQMITCVTVRPSGKKESDDQRRLHTAALVHVRQRGWDLVWECTALRVGSHSADTQGRWTDVLSPQDAEAIYRQIHAAPTVVVATGGVWVRPDPRADPVPTRALVSLERFVRYKAAFALPRSLPELLGVMDAATSDLNQLRCENHLDARALPLHVFAPHADWDDLHTEDGRERFKNDHGTSARRRDGSGRTWETGAKHGRSVLTVAGHDMPAGFHWDVNSKNAASVANAWEVWKINRGGYANIAPDASIRRGQTVKGTPSRRVWHRGSD